MKKVLALMLALALALGCMPALAAPMRDAKNDGGNEIGLKNMVSLAMGAAVLRDEDSLAPGEAPSQALVEGVLALGMQTLMLPYSGGDEILQGKAQLTAEK